MVLVNEAVGYRICLECRDELPLGSDEAALEGWLQVHTDPSGCNRSPGIGQRLLDRLRQRS